jgi:outer membrane protein assembly factor BamD (BamD/ComL family)
MKARFTLAAAVAASLVIACAGVPKSIPESLSARELVQRAQEATDAYHYDAAVAYYKALGERFDTDPLYKTTAVYEIAFIAYKQKRFAEAKESFEALLAKYSGPDGASLPPRYAILSKKVLESIAAKTKPPAAKAPVTGS